MEEDKFYFKPLKEISEYHLKQIWNSRFSDKPFPEVKASIVEEKEFMISQATYKIAMHS
jgi:hypothetical protein